MPRSLPSVAPVPPSLPPPPVRRRRSKLRTPGTATGTPSRRHRPHQSSQPRHPAPRARRRAAPPRPSGRAGSCPFTAPERLPQQTNPDPNGTLPLPDRPCPLPPGPAPPAPARPLLRLVPRLPHSRPSAAPPQAATPAKPMRGQRHPRHGTLQAPRCRLRARRLKGCPRRRLRFRAPVVPPSACAAWTPPAGSLDPPRPPAAGSPYASRSRGKLAKASVSQQPTTGGNQRKGGGQEAVCKTVSSISLTNFCRERGRRLTISICRWSFGVGPGFAPPGSEASTRSLTGTPSARARGATWESGILLRRSRRNPRRLVHANLLGKLRLRQAAGLPQRGKPLSERLEIVGFAFVIGRISFHGTLASFSAKKALTGTVYALKT